MQNFFAFFPYQEESVQSFLLELLFMEYVFCFSFCLYIFFKIPTAHTRIRKSNVNIYHVNI